MSCNCSKMCHSRALLLIVFNLLAVYLCNVEGKVQKGLPIAEIETKIANMKYFLAIFCDDLDDDDCADIIDSVNDIVDGEHTFAGLEAATIEDEALFKKYGVEHYPELVLFRDSDPIFYVDSNIESGAIGIWMEHNRVTHVKTLSDATFEHDTQATSGSTTGDWYIMFYELHCSNLLTQFETIAGWFHQQKVIGKIDLSSNPATKARFAFKDCVTIALFKEGKMYLYNDDLTKADKMASFLRSGYAGTEALPIPPVPSLNVLELSISLWNTMIGKIVVAGFGTLTIILIVVAVLNKRRNRRVKFD